MRGANGGRGEQTPFRIEPELGKVMEDSGKSCSNNAWDVFQHDPSGSYVTDDPRDGWPEPTVIVKSTALPGAAERLAGEAGSDEIHASAPRSAVEGEQIVPHRCLIQARLAHPRHESGRRVGVPLNVSHGSYAVGSQGEFEPAVAGAEVDGGTWSHVTIGSHWAPSRRC